MPRWFSFIIILELLLVCPTETSAGPVYVYKDSAGVVHFTSKKPPSGSSGKVFTAKNSKFSYYSTTGANRWYGTSNRLYTNTYGDIIRAAAATHGVSTGLVRAVIHAESAFNPLAVSPKGALGLMQLMPDNCRRYKVTDPFNPQENINGGVQMLADLIQKYRGNLPLVLAAYNAGEGAVEKHNGIPPYSETQQYVQRVLNLKRRYQGVL